MRVNWKVYIDTLRYAMSKKYADPGYRGELAAQILLLMVFDRATATYLYPNLTNTDANLPNTDGMYSRVLQFVQFFCKPTPAKLVDIFSRAAGIVCKFGAKGKGTRDST